MKKVTQLLLLLSMLFFGQNTFAQITPEFEEYIEKRMDTEQIPGMSIALIEENGLVSYHNYGYMDLDKNNLVDEFTIYEAGSITKTFSAGLLNILMDMYNLSPDTPLKEIFGEELSIPSKDGVEITLHHLVSHTSGLPRLPGNLDPSDPNDPYKDYTPEMLFDFIQSYELPRTPGEEVEYSNLAFMLLGETLQKISGQSYHELIKHWFIDPIDMPSTGKTIVDSLRFAQPTTSNIPTQRWHSDNVSGFGELLSSTHDLARYIKIHLGQLDHTKRELLNNNIQNLNPIGGSFNMGYAWIAATAHDDTVAFHGGGTGGYRSFLGYSTVTKRGAVVMTNATNDIQDIGRHLINSDYGLADITEVFKMSTEQLQKFAGKFVSETLPPMEIYIENNLLMAVLGNQPPLPFLPIDQTIFSNDRVGALLEFESDGDQIHYFLLKQGGSVHTFNKRD